MALDALDTPRAAWHPVVNMFTSGAGLRILRARLRISQHDLAAASGLTRQAIYLIERGLRQPTDATIKTLSHAIEVLHLASAQEVTRKRAEVDDPRSVSAYRDLAARSVAEQLAVRVRLIPYRLAPDDTHHLVVPDYGRSQLVDGLQGVTIYRLFPGMFRFDVLPDWWTPADDYRIGMLNVEHQELDFDERQRCIIAEGP